MGRIGKPQKSRKHKKVKPLDPIKQVESEARKGQHNQKPRNVDQEIPKKAILLGASIKRHASQKQHAGVNKKRKKKFNISDPETRNTSGKKGQSSFNKSTMKTVDDEDIVDKFMFHRSGDINPSITKRAEKMKMRSKEHKQKHKEKKKEKDREKERDFSQFKDDVQFGDIVHAPPSLSVLPCKAHTEQGIPRPGKKSLLLKEVFTSNSSYSQQTPPGGQGGRRELGQTVKRKNLSMAQQHIMDHEREKAVQLYRELKDKKMKRFN
ncbi:coiled-coil domain-containing protein 137-like isoform X2 [Haliotis rubra]|uniref:coiled-coil domain-containing protein 137-like isoform X2 n=1 Tax=Haliotis rubra TaxID=36100 RepID=UPI001EE5404A|nr:coiled-coil domain-containing protein 137-like isoform X2 [Haliotis rubra]